MRKSYRWLILTLWIWTPAPAYSAEDIAVADPNATIESMSLEDLLNMKTQIAASGSTSVREAPGIVTVVTREEIESLGARDLIDVLHWVGGFSFALDVTSVVDAGFRAIWGHEKDLRLRLIYDNYRQADQHRPRPPLAAHLRPISSTCNIVFDRPRSSPSRRGLVYDDNFPGMIQAPRMRI